jgi:hypothetical protein
LDREVPEVKHLPEAEMRGDYFWNSPSPRALLSVKINMYLYIFPMLKPYTFTSNCFLM